jgi:hypothetical protein
MDGNMVSRWIFKKWDEEHVLVWLRTRVCAGSYEHSNELPRSIKCRVFLD